MPFGRFWAESGLVATFCLPVCSPWLGSPPSTRCVPRVWSPNPQRKPTWNPTSLTFGRTSSSKFIKNCHVCLSFAPCCSFHLFLSLLIFVILSCRLCRLLFLSSLSGFLPCCGLLVVFSAVHFRQRNAHSGSKLVFGFLESGMQKNTSPDSTQAWWGKHSPNATRPKKK